AGVGRRSVHRRRRRLRRANRARPRAGARRRDRRLRQRGGGRARLRRCVRPRLEGGPGRDADAARAHLRGRVAMRASRMVTVIGCHAGGEIGNVVVGGVAAPPGESVYERMQALRSDDSLRRLLLREPRGSVAVHANLIVPSLLEDCAAGFIIMEPTEYPAMSGSNTICVATVLLETGIVEMREPETTFKLESPGGVVEVTARCQAGRCESV